MKRSIISLGLVLTGLLHQCGTVLASKPWFQLGLLLVVTAALGAEPTPATPQPSGRRPTPKTEWLDPNRSEPAGTHYRTFTSRLAGGEVSGKDQFGTMFYKHFVGTGFSEETVKALPLLREIACLMMKRISSSVIPELSWIKPGKPCPAEKRCCDGGMTVKALPLL